MQGGNPSSRGQRQDGIVRRRNEGWLVLLVLVVVVGASTWWIPPQFGFKGTQTGSQPTSGTNTVVEEESDGLRRIILVLVVVVVVILLLVALRSRHEMRETLDQDVTARSVDRVGW